MSYEKHPTYACELCHKSFKNKRAFNAHNKAVHPVEQADRLADSDDASATEWWRDIFCDGDARN